MEMIQQVMRNLGPVRLAIIGGATLAMIGFFAWLLSQVTTQNNELLYGDLDVSDSGRIVEELESSGIPHELRNDGSAIYVPADQVAKLRVKLAEQGLPSGGSIGYEIFEDSDALSTTNFMQNVNLVRALEGELARSIRAIDTVRSARVHLVLPKRELFSRERQEPSASVLLQMRGNARLTPSQIVAVQHLVASAVPSLTPQKISIVDGRGTLLAQGFDDEMRMAMASAETEERRRQFENRMAQTVEALVEQTVGAGKVRARVFADMDFDRINTSEEVFDPDGQVVRSSQSIQEEGLAEETDANLPVTVANNLPSAEADLTEGSGSRTSENRTEETVNYEISKKVINHVRESGVINRLSVAVLVDGIYTAGGEGEPVYEPRAQEELDQLATLVRSAIGFDAERGDTVEVINMPFATSQGFEDETPGLVLGFERSQLLDLAKYVVLFIFTLLVLLLVVRPLFTRILEANGPVGATAGAGGHGTDLLAEGSSPPALAPPSSGTPDPSVHGQSSSSVPATTDGITSGALSTATTDGEIEEMIDLNRVSGRVKASSVNQVGEIVNKHPHEALAIVRGWLHADA